MYQENDFDSQGNLNFPQLPHYQEESDKNGNITNLKEHREFNKIQEYSKDLIKFSKYNHTEQLWQNYQQLTATQQSALTLLVSGSNIRDTARECHINEATLYRWLQLDLFTESLKLWQKNIFFEADNKIKNVMDKALEKLELILDNPDNFSQQHYLKAIELSLNLRGKNN